MKNLHMENSYKIWSVRRMTKLITQKCDEIYNTTNYKKILNRNQTSLLIEWWLHNIGYYVTKPFIKIEYFSIINNRCKHVDLEERNHGCNKN